MAIILELLSVINKALFIFTLPPCFMAGLMSLSDSPYPNKNIYSYVLSYFILFFPVICLLCGIIAKYLNIYIAYIVSLFPILTIVFFFFILEIVI